MRDADSDGESRQLFDLALEFEHTPGKGFMKMCRASFIDPHSGEEHWDEKPSKQFLFGVGVSRLWEGDLGSVSTKPETSAGENPTYDGTAGVKTFTPFSKPLRKTRLDKDRADQLHSLPQELSDLVEYYDSGVGTSLANSLQSGSAKKSGKQEKISLVEPHRRILCAIDELNHANRLFEWILRQHAPPFVLGSTHVQSRAGGNETGKEVSTVLLQRKSQLLNAADMLQRAAKNVRFTCQQNARYFQQLRILRKRFPRFPWM